MRLLIGTRGSSLQRVLEARGQGVGTGEAVMDKSSEKHNGGHLG